MKSILRPMLAAFALGLALVPVASRAASQPPEGRVDRLDTLVKLTADQKLRAAEIFRNENAILDAFTNIDDRALKGMDARVESRAQIRALLTPEQRKKFDVSPQSLGGGLPVDPQNLVDRLDQVVSLTADQKAKALQIIWNDLTDQLAATPEGQALKGFMWQQPVRDQLRALLTPAQQAKFDVTSPYRRSGPASAKTGG
jgi:Spy/CpxP family protein refolding chaperone